MTFEIVKQNVHWIRVFSFKHWRAACQHFTIPWFDDRVEIDVRLDGEFDLLFMDRKR